MILKAKINGENREIKLDKSNLKTIFEIKKFDTKHKIDSVLFMEENGNQHKVLASDILLIDNKK